MEKVAYQMKRAHWKVTWVAIRLFERRAVDWKEPVLLEMTPARLDILYLIQQRLAWAGSGKGPMPAMALGDIIKKLGLHPSTISKCVKRMAQLGLVTRGQSPVDARQTIVKLTPWGLEGLDAAFRVIEGLSEDLFHLSRLFGTRLASLAERARRYAYLYGSRAVELWDIDYVDTG